MLPELRLYNRICGYESNIEIDISAEMMSITPEQVIAARGLLRLSRKDLAERAGISERTLADFESEASRETRRSTINLLMMALEREGVEFMDGEYAGDGGPGVRLRGK